jgi:hypothetical protein
MSTLPHRTTDDRTPSVVLTRAAGGALAESRYELVWQLNAIAYAFTGAVLLGVGAFAVLRRA